MTVTRGGPPQTHMSVFACAACDAVLTAPMSRVALPVHAHQSYGHELLPPLMAPGTYAVNPEPWGPPWQEVGDQEAQARGVFAPVRSLSCGPRGSIVVAPGDVRGMILIPEHCDGYCMGLDGRMGPNLACTRCGRAVATRIDDCALWQAVWLMPQAVRRHGDDRPAPRVLGWDELREEHPGLPPVEPPGVWSPLWAAAVASALARLLAASAGSRVTIPDGPLAETFSRPLNALLPPGPPAKRLALAGPGLPTITTEIVLVPQHSQTGETWKPYSAGTAVPLTADIWMYLAFCGGRRPVPGAGRIPDVAHRDDAPPLLPSQPFRPSWDVFLYTLARLPEVREPWLRAIYDRVRTHPFSHPF